MALTHSEIEQRMQLFFDMLQTSHGMTHWVYDAEGNCLQASGSTLMDVLLMHGNGKQDILAHGSSDTTPLLLSLPMGLVWIAAYERQGNTLHRVYVVGPAFHTEISLRGIMGALDLYRIPHPERRKYLDYLNGLPVVPLVSLRKIAVMLHYCVTAEAVSIIDVALWNTADHLDFHIAAGDRKDRHRTYMAEQKLLNHIREGDLNFQSALIEVGSISSGVPVRTESPLSKIRMTQVVFVSLCVRAAIEGGLTPDVAYSTGDAYIQMVNDAQDLQRLASIGHTMYQNFIQLVHDHKQRSDLSKPIQSCCDYIGLHLEDDLTAQTLSERFGYNPVYLARRFAREVGLSPGEYIKQQRIQKACVLLATTTEPIADIAQRFHFCHRGYFSITFKEQMGVTPAAYRKLHQPT